MSPKDEKCSFIYYFLSLRIRYLVFSDNLPDLKGENGAKRGGNVTKTIFFDEYLFFHLTQRFSSCQNTALVSVKEKYLPISMASRA